MQYMPCVQATSTLWFHVLSYKHTKNPVGNLGWSNHIFYIELYSIHVVLKQLHKSECKHNYKRKGEIM